VFGVSSPHGLDIPKVWGTLGSYFTIHLAFVGIKALMSAAQGGSPITRVGGILYSALHIGVVVSTIIQSVLVVWTACLMLAGLWLIITLLWIWLAALNPWDPEVLWALAGVAMRALVLQLSAWIWVAAVAAIGGGAQGPRGAPGLPQ
jgi:hypothetical protein